MIASTSWASRYSGSFFVRAELSDVFGCAPRGRRLRATVWVVMVLLPPCKKFSERFLQMWDFLVQFKEGPSYGGTVADARNVGVFLHLKISSDCLVCCWDMSGSSPVRWADVYGS